MRLTSQYRNVRTFGKDFCLHKYACTLRLNDRLSLCVVFSVLRFGDIFWLFYSRSLVYLLSIQLKLSKQEKNLFNVYSAHTVFGRLFKNPKIRIDLFDYVMHFLFTLHLFSIIGSRFIKNGISSSTSSLRFLSSLHENRSFSRKMNSNFDVNLLMILS